ncbi:hypothetical protein [Streptomyces sp. NPDC056160]|uniref:hypothetical protein n=1 Tax=Streptomyces sp. NPDC056160 TaxID=3345731 RepID=UPI0035DC0103
MRRVPRGAAAAAVTGALLMAAGCGVPTSGVIDAGAPAVGVPADVTVYFVADGVLSPAPRRMPAGAADPVGAAVRLLLAGPNPGEAPKLTTSLPALPGPVGVTVEQYVVSVRFPAGVGRPGTLAMEQLTCTAARALRRSANRENLAIPTYAATPAAPDSSRTSTPVAHISVRATGSGWATARSDAVCPGD